MASAKTVTAGLKKLHALEDMLNDYVVEREQVNHTAVLAPISYKGMHHVQLGVPGAAKTLIPRLVMKAVTDGRKLDKLMTRTMEPDELFGPLTMDGIQQGDYERAIDGYLPTTEFFLSDEIFKCSDALLNNLLTALNERKYTHGNELIDIPLVSCYAASNELYESDALLALWSRFTYRHVIQLVQEKDNFVKMIQQALDHEEAPTEEINLKVSEIRAMQQAVSEVHFGDTAMETLWEIREAMNNVSLPFDDRKAVWIARGVTKAEAFYHGRNEVEAEDFAILQHCLWDTQEQLEKVRTAVLSVASPVQEEIAKMLDAATKAFKNAEKAISDASGGDGDANAAQTTALDSNQEIYDIITDLEARIKRESGNSKSKLQEALDKVVAIHTRLIRDVIKVEV